MVLVYLQKYDLARATEAEDDEMVPELGTPPPYL